MKMLLVAAVAAVLGTSAALAQGLPPALAQQDYDAHVLPHAQYQNKTIFSELFGPSRPAHEATARSTEQVSKADKGNADKGS